MVDVVLSFGPTGVRLAADEVVVQLKIQDVAKLVAGAGCSQQVRLLNAVAARVRETHADGTGVIQLFHVAASEELSDEARELMRRIGEAAQ